ncbi:hypothetical protein CEXT_209811 [Caerostris extrusa]|uniref:Uncharacterized protein n=1 Tax=Caerostris extrusa TaxID=172846 RepID=A0AAV4WKV3_CAEEX|nr:hypothetical protein CEXT_209811 [Caerostris extrusa]
MVISTEPVIMCVTATKIVASREKARLAVLKVKIGCGMMLNMSLWPTAQRLPLRFAIGSYLRPNYAFYTNKGAAPGLS